MTYANILTSNAAYPQAATGGAGAPSVTPGNRRGMSFFNVYYKHHFTDGMLQGWYFSADYAHQKNSRIDMEAWAGRIQARYVFRSKKYQPRMMYSHQTFSGDDPNTPSQERFDPLFFEGSPSSWATGTKSAMTFINSNVKSHQLEWSLKPSIKDTLTLRYAHIRVDKIRSPVQFGQAVRFELAGNDNIVAGVTKPHLADDVFIEYSRILTPNKYLTAGFSVSMPGEGLDAAASRNLPNWMGGFVNIVINY
ncbi:alginate export family protein [Marinicella sp. S1101]|uniref:alginate export family protein n=1 Tax=Marinicella marina TaxID=2996016 RepID=UPI002260F102|nr:alginate export family protein [Marinicella marina]MCX7554367.1 alginate export family protein [Marinicella marina]MDJ1138642.1 alginate export family protein [Marinicella marina]